MPILISDLASRYVKFCKNTDNKDIFIKVFLFLHIFSLSLIHSLLERSPTAKIQH